MEYQLPGWVLSPDTPWNAVCTSRNARTQSNKSGCMGRPIHAYLESGVVVLKVSLMVFQLVHLLTWTLVGKQMLPSIPTSHRHNYQRAHTQNCRVTCPSQGETPEMTKRKLNSLGCCFS